jgi:hypothetical protein
VFTTFQHKVHHSTFGVVDNHIDQGLLKIQGISQANTSTPPPDQAQPPLQRVGSNPRLHTNVYPFEHTAAAGPVLLIVCRSSWLCSGVGGIAPPMPLVAGLRCLGFFLGTGSSTTMGLSSPAAPASCGFSLLRKEHRVTLLRWGSC